MLKPIPVWLVAFALSTSVVTEARAGYIVNTLADAGPNSFGILSLTTTAAVQMNNAGTTVGNVGVSSGVFQLNSGCNKSPLAVQGNVYLGNNTRLDQDGGKISGSVFTNQNAMLGLADSDALSAAKTFSALKATQTVPGGKITGSTTLTGVAGINVLDVSGIGLGHGQTLTLAGPAGAQWVINDSGGLLVCSGAIVESGGLTSSDVVFNLTGHSILSGSFGLADSSIINGIILAPHAMIGLNGSVVNGEVISGGFAIQLNAGALVNAADPPSSTPVTPAPSSLVLMSLAAVGLAGMWIRMARRSSPLA